MKPTVGWLALALLAVTTSPATGNDALVRGVDAFERRAEGHDGPRADPGPIREAIAAFEEAVTQEPANVAARVRLLHALYYLGEYAVADRDAKLEIFERGRRVAEEGIDLLTADFPGDPRPSWRDEATHRALRTHLADEPDAAGIYLWSAVHWGLWGRQRGRLAAAREGIAGTIRDYGTLVVAIDPEYESAGGHRILGRLHHEAPRIPLVTGWIDRETAVAELTRAVELGPDNLLNHLYWIEAVLEYDRDRRNEAIRQLRELAGAEPGSEEIVEELQVLRDARALLQRIGE